MEPALAQPRWRCGSGPAPDAPDVWDVHAGGLVTVRVTGNHVLLEGPAELVAEGTVSVPTF